MINYEVLYTKCNTVYHDSLVLVTTVCTQTLHESQQLF